MTQSFNEWFATYRPSLDTSAIEAEFIFEAGAQSKQAEIDEYKLVAETMEDLYIRSNKREKEFQKRIDEALNLIYKEKQAVECDKYKGIDADLIIGIGYELHLILKGATNEQ